MFQIRTTRQNQAAERAETKFEEAGSEAAGLPTFGRRVGQALRLVKQMDTSSSEFTTAVLYAQVFSPVILSALKTGGDSNPYTRMRLTMTNGIFTSFQVGGSNGSSILPMEQISFQPASIKFESFVQNTDGSVVLAASNTVTCQKPK